MAIIVGSGKVVPLSINRQISCRTRQSEGMEFVLRVRFPEKQMAIGFAAGRDDQRVGPIEKGFPRHRRQIFFRFLLLYDLARLKIENHITWLDLATEVIRSGAKTTDCQLFSVGVK